jgi:hypothetical protein
LHRSDKHEASSAHRLGHSSKRRRKDERGNRDLNREIDRDTLVERLHDVRHSEHSFGTSRTSVGGSPAWSPDRPGAAGRFNETVMSQSQLHYMDIVGDKETQRYGATASSNCPHYRRDESTFLKCRFPDDRWACAGATSTVSHHKDYRQVEPRHRSCEIGPALCEYSCASQPDLLDPPLRTADQARRGTFAIPSKHGGFRLRSRICIGGSDST